MPYCFYCKAETGHSEYNCPYKRREDNERRRHDDLMREERRRTAAVEHMRDAAEAERKEARAQQRLQVQGSKQLHRIELSAKRILKEARTDPVGGYAGILFVSRAADSLPVEAVPADQRSALTRLVARLEDRREKLESSLGAETVEALETWIALASDEKRANSRLAAARQALRKHREDVSHQQMPEPSNEMEARLQAQTAQQQVAALAPSEPPQPKYMSFIRSGMPALGTGEFAGWSPSWGDGPTPSPRLLLRIGVAGLVLGGLAFVIPQFLATSTLDGMIEKSLASFRQLDIGLAPTSGVVAFVIFALAAFVRKGQLVADEHKEQVHSAWYSQVSRVAGANA